MQFAKALKALLLSTLCILALHSEALAKICRKGTACENTCIAAWKTCHVGRGSAINEYELTQPYEESPVKEAGTGGGGGHSQISDEGNPDFLKGAGEKIQNILGNNGERPGKADSDLKGFGGFDTRGKGGSGLSGGDAAQLGGLGKRGRGGERIGTGLGARARESADTNELPTNALLARFRSFSSQGFFMFTTDPQTAFKCEARCHEMASLTAGAELVFYKNDVVEFSTDLGPRSCKIKKCDPAF